MDANLKLDISPPRRRVLRYALALSLAVHLAAFAAGAFWPRAVERARPAPPPIKVTAVIEKPPPRQETPPPAPASRQIEPARQARAAVELRDASPHEPQPPRALVRRPMAAPPPAQPTLEAESSAMNGPRHHAAPRAALPLPIIARNAALPASGPAPAPLPRPRAVAARSPLRDFDAVPARAAAPSVQPVAFSPAAAAHPLSAPQETPRFSARPAAAAASGKIVRPAPSPLQAIAVEFQPSRMAVEGPRPPAAPAPAPAGRIREARLAAVSPAAVPAEFDTVDLGAIRDGYSSLVRGRIARAREYPQAGRKQGHEGRPVVSFLVGEAGELLELSLLDSSGYPTLDEAALAAVAKAAPFPGIPAPLGVRSMRFKLPVSFKLESP